MSKLITIKKSSIFKYVCKNGYTIKSNAYTLKFLPCINAAKNKDAAKSLIINNIQFGFIISKKVGHAVKRNYIRRRLKEAINLCLKCFEYNGFYIFIVNKELSSLKFDDVLQHIEITLITLKEILNLNFNENIS